MQKWCPESLIVEPTSGGAFESMSPAGAASIEADRADFRPEAGFIDTHALLRQLSRAERAQVMELLDQDLRREYEERYQRELAERQQLEAERIGAEVAALEAWQSKLAEDIRKEVEDALATVARQTVTFATLMADKLVRRAVDADPEVLVRTLETVLYKAEAGSSLSVTVHPDDAAWLENAPDLRERLRISEIKADRRLERGGCLVRANELEWDATVERQLSVLGEALEEALAVPVDPAESADDPAPEDDDA